jgi:hypothetical protein
MQPADGLVLRDIHASVAPAWWPPAPGWWWLSAALVLVLAALLAWRVLRARRRRRIERLFDDTVGAAATPSARVAAISELLRRAARQRDPAADRLDGEAWLAFLDAGGPPRFEGESGHLLLDGGYRREVGAGSVERLRAAARARFLQWMAP